MTIQEERMRTAQDIIARAIATQRYGGELTGADLAAADIAVRKLTEAGWTLSQRYPGYPESYGACIICGASKGQVCDTLRAPGTPRSAAPHSARATRPEDGPQGRFCAVRDEREWGEQPARWSHAEADARDGQ